MEFVEPTGVIAVVAVRLAVGVTVDVSVGLAVGMAGAVRVIEAVVAGGVAVARVAATGVREAGERDLMERSEVDTGLEKVLPGAEERTGLTEAEAVLG